MKSGGEGEAMCGGSCGGCVVDHPIRPVCKTKINFSEWVSNQPNTRKIRSEDRAQKHDVSVQSSVTKDCPTRYS